LPEQRRTTGTPSGHADDWDEHWSRYAQAAVLNPAQDFRRRLIIDGLAISGAGARILDIGSGTGDLAADLIAELRSPEVRGVELSATGVELARRKVPGAEFRQWDLLTDRTVPDEDAGWADHAVCSEVLEHVDDPVALLRNARAFLAPGCRLVVTVPGGPISAFDRHIGHRRHFSPADAGATLSAAGYEVESVRGVGFPFFNLYRLLVIAAGERLIEPESSAGAAPPGRMRRFADRLFRALFRRNRGGSRLGFQTVAVARNPGAGTTSS
jgi:SAM-dependent methyltransferase